MEILYSVKIHIFPIEILVWFVLVLFGTNLKCLTQKCFTKCQDLCHFWLNSLCLNLLRPRLPNILKHVHVVRVLQPAWGLQWGMLLTSVQRNEGANFPLKRWSFIHQLLQQSHKCWFTNIQSNGCLHLFENCCTCLETIRTWTVCSDNCGSTWECCFFMKNPFTRTSVS